LSVTCNRCTPSELRFFDDCHFIWCYLLSDTIKFIQQAALWKVGLKGIRTGKILLLYRHFIVIYEQRKTWSSKNRGCSDNHFLSWNSLFIVTRMQMREPSWTWSYGSWIYNYLCNQCLSPQKANYNWTWTSIIGENKANDFCSDHVQPKVCPKYESMTLGSKSYFGTGTLHLILALEDLEAVIVLIAW
jgi:hypothetical protein